MNAPLTPNATASNHAASTNFLQETRRGAVLCLTLNRPPTNSLNLAFFQQLRERLKILAQDNNVRALVLESAFSKYFSSGIDLEEYMSLAPQERSALFLELIELHRELAFWPKPTVAAISGYAFLGGWIIAMGCDYRLLAQENGKIALSEIRLGLTPTTILIRTIVGFGARQNLVKDLILSGKTLKSTEAYEGGFVDRLVPVKTLASESLILAQRLSQMPAHAYAVTKRIYRETLLGDPEAAFEQSKKEFIEMLAHWEATEGLAAAREKRRANFHGDLGRNDDNIQ